MKILTVMDEGGSVSSTPVWCSCRWDGSSAYLLTSDQSQYPCDSGRAASRATPWQPDRWEAPRTYRRTRPEPRNRCSREAKQTEAIWRKRTQPRQRVHRPSTLRLAIGPPSPAVSPAQLILADLLQDMRGWVVGEVLHSVHGFVHGGDVFHRPLLFVLVVVQDVVDATQPCPGTK